MILSINNSAKAAYPNLRVAIIEVKLNKEISFNQEFLKIKDDVESAIKTEHQNPENNERVKKYNAFYKKFDSKVPMEFQIRSVLNGKDIPMTNPILTCMFLAELKNVILTAGHDLNQLEEDIEVRISDGSEEYTKINEKLQKLKPNDIYAKDNNGIISSVLFGPDSRTKITKDTKNCLFMCYAFDLTKEELIEHLEDIAKYLKIMSGNGIQISNINIA